MFYDCFVMFNRSNFTKMNRTVLVFVVILFTILLQSCNKCSDKDLIVKRQYEFLIKSSEKHLEIIRSHNSSKYLSSDIFLRNYYYPYDYNGPRVLRDILFYNKYFDLQLSSDKIQQISILIGEKDDLIIEMEQKDTISNQMLKNLVKAEENLYVEYKKILKMINSKL